MVLSEDVMTRAAVIRHHFEKNGSIGSAIEAIIWLTVIDLLQGTVEVSCHHDSETVLLRQFCDTAMQQLRQQAHQHCRFLLPEMGSHFKPFDLVLHSFSKLCLGNESRGIDVEEKERSVASNETSALGIDLIDVHPRDIEVLHRETLCLNQRAKPRESSLWLPA